MWTVRQVDTGGLRLNSRERRAALAAEPQALRPFIHDERAQFYDELHPALAEELHERAERIHGRGKRRVEDAIADGKDLQTHATRGQFIRWIHLEFEWSYSTAEKLMQVARLGARWEADSPAKFTQYVNLGMAIAYELAEPNVPDAAVKAILSGRVPSRVAAARQEIDRQRIALLPEPQRKRMTDYRANGVTLGYQRLLAQVQREIVT